MILLHQLFKILLLRMVPTQKFKSAAGAKSQGVGGKTGVGNHPALKFKIAILLTSLPLVYDVVDPGADIERNLHTGVLTLTVVKLTFNQVLKPMIGGNNVYLVLHTHTDHLLPHFYLVTLSLKNLTNRSEE